LVFVLMTLGPGTQSLGLEHLSLDNNCAVVMVMLVMVFSISADGVELRVDKSNVEDAALYSCVARNLAGQTEKNFHVDVLSTCN